MAGEVEVGTGRGGGEMREGVIVRALRAELIGDVAD